MIFNKKKETMEKNERIITKDYWDGYCEGYKIGWNINKTTTDYELSKAELKGMAKGGFAVLFGLTIGLILKTIGVIK